MQTLKGPHPHAPLGSTVGFRAHRENLLRLKIIPCEKEKQNDYLFDSTAQNGQNMRASQKT